MITENQKQYVELLRKRALGEMPDMGSAIRLTNIIASYNPVDFSILDIGGASGHYLRTFIGKKLIPKKYECLEIDPYLVKNGREIWMSEIKKGSVEFINANVHNFKLKKQYDFIIIMNAFMYFENIKVIFENILNNVTKAVIIRSYFGRENYRILRAQTKNNHDRSEIEEIDAFDKNGNMVSYDMWNIYTHSYIESIIKNINLNKKINWIKDSNYIESINHEHKLNIKKDGATEYRDGYEISYPFILPWEYLIIEDI